MGKTEENERTELLKTDIDKIVEEKMRGLSYFGEILAIEALEEIKRLKEHKASNIDIFDQMANLCRILRDYRSYTKTKQERLFG